MRIASQTRSAAGTRVGITILAAILLTAASSDLPQALSSSLIDVFPAELNAQPPGANWLSYNGDFTGRRYSSLSQITPENVGQLRAQWIFHSSNSEKLEATPLVVNGTMFVTSANDTYALDARTGREIWQHTRPVSAGLIDDARLRGTAVTLAAAVRSAGVTTAIT